MPRAPNAVDFWRGFALVSIFINHIPGIFFDKFTHRAVSISDSAELFVFLAGWSLRYVIGDAGRPRPMHEVVFRVGGRAVTLYAAHMMIVMLAIAILAATARLLDNPLLLEWHNAAAVFYRPVETHVGLALLTHQLGYFDILPLYVALMLFAPFLAILDRIAPALLLPASFVLYITSLVVPLTIPAWPIEGQWFFNPLTWQFVFVLGLVMGRTSGVGGWVRRHIVPIRWVSLPIVLIGMIFVLTGGKWIDPTSVPDPKLLFINGKTFATPIRVIQFLALVAVMSIVYPYIARAVPSAVGYLSMLGRNSLEVFCAGSILSLICQILRFALPDGILLDTLLLIGGVALMGMVAWLAEWRTRVVAVA
ncbi:MAG TPA: OpgC domain-containing protein [Hyphomicrobiaceae bacterium]|nr:OpgC domain-containing protein [Hyphomicrobiaceae bacterium]